MRKVFVAALLLLCISTGAKATSDEPFGARFEVVPDIGFINLREEVLEEKKDLIASIVEKVQQKKPKEAWLAWTSQLVNLAGLGRDNCATTAIVELAVLYRLGIASEDLRYVVGAETASSTHAVAAVRIRGVWLILENHNLIRSYQAVADTGVKSSFHALVAYK